MSLPPASASDPSLKNELKIERKIVALLCAVNFVNVLDFMMVMPLGPDFARALGIPSSHLGWIGGSYTAAASIAGVVSSFFLDRFDRRKALAVAVFGLSIATLLGGLAFNFETLLAARILAGIFGGPASSLAFSIVADSVPIARRGRATGAVMSSFSIASIIGVPAGLEMARLGGWRTPFFAVGVLMLVVNLGVFLLIPPMRAHLKNRKSQSAGVLSSLQKTAELLGRREVLLSYGAMAASMFAGFMMIPNFSAYFQFNLGFPRENLGLLYLFGGIASLVLMQIAGRLIDRFNASVVGVVATALLVSVLFLGYHEYPPLLPPYLIFVGFMSAMSVRGVVAGSLASRVPDPSERARFMSFHSAVQHATAALGAFFSTLVLAEGVGGALVGMPALSAWSIGVSLLIPACIIPLERRVRRRERTQAQALAQAQAQTEVPAV